MVHSSLSSLQHVGRITCDTVHSDGTKCKHAVKDEGDINKLQDFSVTTYSKCERGERRRWQPKEPGEITSFLWFMSFILMLLLQMNALGRPRISFHRAGAIKRLKNGGFMKQELKGETSSISFLSYYQDVQRLL